MKLNKTIGRVATTLVATAMLASLAAPAMAADYVAGADEVAFTKTIDMSGAPGATVPNATYQYSIAQGDAVEAGVNTPEIKAGVVVTGQDNQVTAPTISDAEFTPADAINNEGKAVETVSVDFSGITFTQPGIYRYEITEADPNVAGLTTDGANTLYLDVYVVDENGAMKISNYVMLTEAITPDLTVNGDTQKTEAVYGDKSKKFSGNDDDAYVTYELTVQKNVSGAMGDKTVPFDFTINFDNLSEGTKVSTKNVTAGEGAESTVTTYTPSNGANAAGETSVSASLKHGEEVTISGVPADALYEVVETLPNTAGYTVSYKIDNAENFTSITGGKGETETTYSTSDPDDKQMNNVDHKVVVNNFKDSVTPTGIIMNVAPYALLVVIAAAGCFVFLRKRRED